MLAAMPCTALSEDVGAAARSAEEEEEEEEKVTGPAVLRFLAA